MSSRSPACLHFLTKSIRTVKTQKHCHNEVTCTGGFALCLQKLKLWPKPFHQQQILLQISGSSSHLHSPFQWEQKSSQANVSTVLGVKFPKLSNWLHSWEANSSTTLNVPFLKLMIPPSDLSCLCFHQSLGPHHGPSRLKHRKQCNKWISIRFGKNWSYFFSKWSRQLNFFITVHFIYLLCQIWIDRKITFSLSQSSRSVTSFTKINEMGCSKAKSHWRAHKSLSVSIKNNVTFYWRHLWGKKCHLTYRRCSMSISGFFYGFPVLYSGSEIQKKNPLGSHLQYHAHTLSISIVRWIITTSTFQTSKCQQNCNKQLQQELQGNRITAALKDRSCDPTHKWL